jgi:hypothetical protein
MFGIDWHSELSCWRPENSYGWRSLKPRCSLSCSNSYWSDSTCYADSVAQIIEGLSIIDSHRYDHREDALRHCFRSFEDQNHFHLLFDRRCNFADSE